MKKIYYLLAIVALGLSACQKEPVLQNSVPPSTKQTLNITLQTSDYQKLTSGYPKTAFSFDDVADANTYIPQILSAEYLTAANGSIANVTYNQTSLYFKAADSIYKVTTAGTDTGKDAYYALTAADYLLLPGNKYTDFSVAQMLTWLPYKFPNVANNTVRIISWTIYPTGATPAVPYTFLYTDGAWRAIYTVQPAQYTALGVGKYDQFTSAFTNIPQTMAALVNADVSITDTIKKNDIVYVSYNYYVSATADYQRVQPLQWNGTSFVAPYSTIATGTYVKSNGTWKPQPIVTHTLTTADIAIITSSNVASSTILANLKSYGDFESAWTPAELDAAFILVLKADYTAPVVGTNYQVVFLSYVGGSDVNTTYTFQWDGTKWTGLQ
ncbi:hypothetical protein [Mucilaginibacter sp. L196]|uniref:hypothetical protein n=1 Tax=Mucilaginibacter sp. L196 TaxID=1641870 RepID=UPI00131ABC5D|nr:hypothetical protein [Mucilaginibacter sp. L196]